MAFRVLHPTDEFLNYMPFIIKQPETEEEFEQYYDLRWRILRAPWGEAKGSEIDDIEDRCYHVMVTDDDDCIGTGRLQYNTDNEAQIRYMAVADGYERQGIGKLIVEVLEREASSTRHNTIMLDAREPAVGFYEKLGYEVKEKSYLLFNSIQHFRMTKTLK